MLKGRQILTPLFGADALKPQPMGTVVKGLLHIGSVTLVYGPPKSGKSFLMSSVGIAVAAGDPEWMGLKIVRPGVVLYVACEGHAGFWKRLRASMIRRGSHPDRFVLACGRPALLQLNGRNAIATPHPNDVLEAIDDCHLTIGEPVLVVIDTVFRSFGGANVNQSDHMNAYLAAVTEIADRGIAVALVHHETKGSSTPAGSVTLMGAADTIVKTRNGAPGEHSWEVEFAKDDAKTEPRRFKLEVEEVGIDDDGETQSSCVMVDLGNGPPEATKRGRRKNVDERDRVYEILCSVLLDHGQPAIMPGIPSSVPTVVHIERWREAFKQLCRPGEDDNTKRKAFRTCVKDLQDQRRIGVLDLWVWPLYGTTGQNAEN